MELTTARLRTRDLAYIGVFTALMAVCSWISIPTTVPFTLQTMAVFLAVGILGGKRGTLAVLAFILLGAVGAPVFSNFRGGLSVLLGATGGYILGFFFQALLYWWMTARLGEALRVKIAASVLGLILCYAFGTAWYLVLYVQMGKPMGLLTALGYCVFPFIVPDLVKLALAVLLSQRVGKYVQ